MGETDSFTDKAYPYVAQMVTHYDQVWSACPKAEKEGASEEAGPKGLGLIASQSLSVDAGDVGTWAEVELEAATEGLKESPGEAGVVLPILLPGVEFEATPGLWPLGSRLRVPGSYEGSWVRSRSRHAGCGGLSGGAVSAEQ